LRAVLENTAHAPAIRSGTGGDELGRSIETPALRAGASTTITAQPVGFSGQRDGKTGVAFLNLHMHGCALHVFVTIGSIKNMWRRSNYCI
jgi:hypothetical protein